MIVIDEYCYNYYMMDGSAPRFQQGDIISFACRPYRDTNDNKYFNFPVRCWEPTKPAIPRYIVTNVLAVN